MVVSKQDIQKGTAGPRRIQSKKEAQEFGKAHAGITVCPECKSAYYEKSWHTSIDTTPEHLKTGEILSHLCPADQWKQERRYEGQVVIALPIDNPTARETVLNTIAHSDHQARQKDTLDRVLWTEEKGNIISVYTSENQLAVRIGKKLAGAFRGSTLDINHSHEEDVIRVHLTL